MASAPALGARCGGVLWALRRVLLLRANAPVWAAVEVAVAVAVATLPGAETVSAMTAPPAMSATDLSRQQRQRVSDRAWRSGSMAAGADTQVPWSEDAKLIAQDARIYLDVQCVDGQPLVGLRLDGQVRISGAAAACVLCHRQRGLGAVRD